MSYVMKLCLEVDLWAPEIEAVFTAQQLCFVENV